MFIFKWIYSDTKSYWVFNIRFKIPTTFSNELFLNDFSFSPYSQHITLYAHLIPNPMENDNKIISFPKVIDKRYRCRLWFLPSQYNKLLLGLIFLFFLILKAQHCYYLSVSLLCVNTLLSLLTFCIIIVALSIYWILELYLRCPFLWFLVFIANFFNSVSWNFLSHLTMTN